MICRNQQIVSPYSAPVANLCLSRYDRHRDKETVLLCALSGGTRRWTQDDKMMGLREITDDKRDTQLSEQNYA